MDDSLLKNREALLKNHNIPSFKFFSILEEFSVFMAPWYIKLYKTEAGIYDFSIYIQCS